MARPDPGVAGLLRDIERACAAARQAAADLAAALSAPREIRDGPAMERSFATLGRIRGQLQALEGRRVALMKSADWRRLPLPLRRRFEAEALYGAEPRRMFELWNKVLRTARFCAEHAPQPLYDPPLHPGSAEAQRRGALDRLLIQLHEFVNARDLQDATSDEKGYFKDIPLPGSVFCEHAQAAYRVCLAQRREMPVRFLDVGCGGGTKVVLASEFFGRAEGLEYDPNYAAAGKALVAAVGQGHCHVFEADGLEFEGYDRYDVIYFYQPIRDTELLQALEARIVGLARPGTVIIAPYLGFIGRAEGLGCGRVDGHVWVTQTAQNEADALRARAEALGAVMIPRPMDVDRNAGVLSPLTEVLRENGFQVGLGVEIKPVA